MTQYIQRIQSHNCIFLLNTEMLYYRLFNFFIISYLLIRCWGMLLIFIIIFMNFTLTLLKMFHYFVGTKIRHIYFLISAKYITKLKRNIFSQIYFCLLHRNLNKKANYYYQILVGIVGFCLLNVICNNQSITHTHFCFIRRQRVQSRDSKSLCANWMSRLWFKRS